MSHGVDPVESHLEAHDWAAFAGYAALLGVGFAAGLMSLVYYDDWLSGEAGDAARRARARPPSTSSSIAPGSSRSRPAGGSRS